jgi:cytochrome c biogenesis protein CcdA
MLLAMVALGLPVVGAFTIGSGDGLDGVNGFVESLSGNSSTWLGGIGLGILAPLGFAFAAGMASAVNPCGFAMLPAYLGLYLGGDQEAAQATSPVRNLGKAMLVGSTVTAGFVVLFGVAGAVIGVGARSFVVGVLPWLGLTVGIALALAGSWMVGGGKLYTGLAAQAASRMGDPTKTNIKGYFIFGLSYGTASLSCTLPIFLAVVGTSLAVTNLFAAMGQFVLYALGMGMVILALTLGIAFFKQAMVGALRKAMPYVQPVGSWLMVVAGAYIVFYWLTIGGLL